MKIGTKVRVLFPDRDGEEFGFIMSERFKESDWFWYWVRFERVSYCVTEDRVVEIKD